MELRKQIYTTACQRYDWITEEGAAIATRKAGSMKKSSGFTLIEAVAVLIVLGILGVIVTTKYTTQGTDSVADARILKDAIRQTQMRAMSDLPDAQWNISVASKQATIKKDTTTVTSYALSSYNGTFSIAFDEFGTPTSVPTLPYSITMDAVTGFIP